MNKEEIWNAIIGLSRSQGFYGRLAESIEESGQKEEILQELEDKKFGDVLDLVLFLEEG